MKKLFSTILVLGLLLSGNAYAKNFEGDKLLGEWIINRYTGEANKSTSGFLTSYWNCKVSKKLF
mgnify:CR=1 FL=1